ncbi:MAG: glutamine synthetase [Dehalococcoidia bacterium]|nr:glutamine synthetase [Dehalococcoidia bacterium]
MANYAEETGHAVAQYLDKPQQDITREDLIRYVKRNEVQFVQFRHVGGDGRLKTLSFVVESERQLDRLLAEGERVDGSSLLPYVDTASSDLYVVPRYRTAFPNPFTPYPSLDILCTYYTGKGERLPVSPENVLLKSQQVLKERTGFTLDALGELEYYVVFPERTLYPLNPQRGYHESSPFSRGEYLRNEVMKTLARAGVKVKYGHSEVGSICENGQVMEQHEIELALAPIEEAADHLAIAMWMLRMVGCKEGVAVTFAPKILPGHAGSGMHVHTRLMQNGRNVMTENGELSDVARKVIAGYLTLAPSLTAFGNTIPTSYMRLVPHQEAPTHICWGDRNRSALIRVPLGWQKVGDMARDANPQQINTASPVGDSQTVEIRSPDGSAQAYLLLAGLAVAARHGLEMQDALDVAAKQYVDGNIFHEDHKAVRESLPHLPASCVQSGVKLLEQRGFYESEGVFPAAVIETTASRLSAHNDDGLVQRVTGNYEEMSRLIEKYLYCP